MSPNTYSNTDNVFSKIDSDTTAYFNTESEEYWREKERTYKKSNESRGSKHRKGKSQKGCFGKKK